jgi:hypothetical protein
MEDFVLGGTTARVGKRPLRHFMENFWQGWLRLEFVELGSPGLIIARELYE